MCFEEKHVPILIVDDEENILKSVRFALELEGYEAVFTSADSRKVLEIISEQKIRIVVLDISMPYLDGCELLDIITEKYPDITIIMLTCAHNTDTVVSCMKKGAFDYIVKPIDESRLITGIKKALEQMLSTHESELIKDTVLLGKINKPDTFQNIITNDQKHLSLFAYIEAIAPSKKPVLISGETGVGKELFAEALHVASNAGGKLITVNCAGIDSTLFSDTLFGHVQNGFTGANEKRIGLVEQATKGTLFLDEIGDLNQECQLKLLRLIQDNSYYPIGSDLVKKSTARIIAATNKNLEKAVKDGSFRHDLYYRLKSHYISIPSLREHLSDIPLLVRHFLEKAGSEMGKKIPIPTNELFVLLQNYTFPGNVRELEAMIYDAVSRQQHIGTLSSDSFKSVISEKNKNSAEIQLPQKNIPSTIFPTPLPSLEDVERQLVVEALKRCNGNKTLAAHMIGVTRTTFRKKIPDSCNSSTK